MIRLVDAISTISLGKKVLCRLNLRDWLDKWELNNLKFNTKFLSLEFSFTDADANAAWEMYVELLTRVTTQHLLPDSGDEKTALKSIHSLFEITREILKKHGRECVEFTKISVIILNQIVRPFTAKWHKKCLENAFDSLDECKNFRIELAELQKNIRNYTKALSDIAKVEDITEMEDLM